jgi:hypothetical protein
MKRLDSVLLAAVVFFLAAACSLPAHAAIRLIITDGNPADTVTLFSPPGNNNAGVFNAAIDDVEVVANIVTSNFPGNAAGANLIQSININDLMPTGSGVLPTLTFTADIVSDADHNVLQIFTAPAAPTLQVSSDVTNVEPVFLSSSGTVQNITTVNGVAVPSAVVPINGSAPSSQAFISDGAGFTLSSEVILTGAAVGTALSIGSTSSVVAATGANPGVPEPSSLAVVGLGGAALAFWAVKRRRTKSVS